MTHRISRRAAVKGAAAASLPFILPSGVTAASRKRVQLVGAGAFDCGVMAGIPGQHAITVWTHVAEQERSGFVRLEIAKDEGFGQVVHTDTVRVASVRDFTARATVRSSKLLDPGERYFYRFAHGGGSSPVGRFTTARPADSKEPLRIGFFSCQKWTSGLYEAHRGLAAEPDLDLVLCLGDYIYEGGGENAEIGRRDTIGPDGQAETLGEFRDKYKLYLSDPNLRDMHAASAFAGIWDDHEAENDYAGENPGTLDPARRRIDFATRRANGYTAWFEYGPRNTIPAERRRTYRRIKLGGMADILMLDTRQYRDRAGKAGDRSRTLLGGPQRTWLKGALSESTASWKVIANQVMAMGLDLAPGMPLNPDQWDGYPGDRADVFGHIRERGIEGATVITGDIHTFFAGDLYPEGRADGGRPAATEFVGGAISSLGLEEDLGELTPAAEIAAVTSNTPHLKYAQLSRRGYGVLELSSEELRCTFRSPRSAFVENSPIEDLARFRADRVEGRVERT